MSCTYNEKQAIDWYTGTGYQLINAHLRGDHVVRNPRDYCPMMIGDAIAHLDTYINKNVLTDDVVVYRGMSSYRLPQDMSPGHIIEFVYFLSTSTDLSIASSYSRTNGGVVLQITVPRGSFGVYVDVLGESELLLPRNTKLAFQSSETRVVPDIERDRIERTIHHFSVCND